jgi:putative tryptophan/tyrosine transport system substrate-binding protein
MRRRAFFIPPLKEEGGPPDPREGGGKAAGWGDPLRRDFLFVPHPARCARHPPPSGEGLANLRRRDVIFALAGAAAWPLAARAQQPMPVIGFLALLSPEAFALEIAAFRRGLGELGYVEGRNVTVEFRWARGEFDRLPALATDLVRRGPNVIAAVGTPASALAVKAATTSIPIVFTTGADPVQLGLVASLSRPGGNATGVYMLASALEAKRLELLHEVVPAAAAIGVIIDPNSPDTELQLRELAEAAPPLGRRIKILPAATDNDIAAAFAAAVEQRVEALLVTSSPSYMPRQQQIVALAARHGLPTIYFFRAFAEAGGLMSYGTDRADAYRHAGVYAGRVLKGEKATDLPVLQSSKVEFVINQKTAKTLGLTFPLPLLGRADEVIE